MNPSKKDEERTTGNVALFEGLVVLVLTILSDCENNDRGLNGIQEEPIVVVLVLLRSDCA